MWEGTPSCLWCLYMAVGASTPPLEIKEVVAKLSHLEFSPPSPVLHTLLAPSAVGPPVFFSSYGSRAKVLCMEEIWVAMLLPSGSEAMHCGLSRKPCRHQAGPEQGFHLLKPGSPETTLCPCALCATQLAGARLFPLSLGAVMWETLPTASCTVEAFTHRSLVPRRLPRQARDCLEVPSVCVSDYWSLSKVPDCPFFTF